MINDTNYNNNDNNNNNNNDDSNNKINKLFQSCSPQISPTWPKEPVIIQVDETRKNN